jgi:hypothetical protein
VIRVLIEPTGRVGKRGPTYQVSYAGEVIVEASIAAEYDACRVLKSRGISGRMVTFGTDGLPRLSMDIDKSAELTVTEGGGEGVRVRRWRPFEGLGDGEEDETPPVERPADAKDPSND